MRISGKIAVVTGAGHGIGRAAALRLAAEGARVAAIDIAADSLVELAAKGIAIEIGDCTDAATAQRFIERLGPVDILFNNVGQSARERASAFQSRGGRRGASCSRSRC